MSGKNYLREKQCACCYIRLDQLKKGEIRAVKSQELLDKLNAAKRTILEQKNKPINENVIQTDDLVCKNCINFANRQFTTSQPTTSQPTISQPTISQSTNQSTSQSANLSVCKRNDI